MTKFFALLSIFTVFALISSGSLPNRGDEMAGYFSNHFSRVENQKELIDSFQLKKDQKAEVVDFLRKYRKEGLPIPRVIQKQSVLQMKYNDSSSEIDFDKSEQGIYKVDAKVIQITPEENIESIYRKILPPKTSSIWIEQAIAAPLSIENKAAMAALITRVAEMQKTAIFEKPADKKAVDTKKTNSETNKVPGSK